MKEEKSVAKYANERVKELYSYLNIDQEPDIVVVRFLEENNKIILHSKNKELEYKPAEDFIYGSSSGKSFDTYYENLGQKAIKEKQNDLIGIDNFALFTIDKGRNSKDILHVVLIINKNDDNFEKPFCKEVLNRISIKGINIEFEEEILNYSGEQVLKKVYENYSNIKYEDIRLFQSFHEISLMSYEGIENTGRILFCSGDKKLYLDQEIRLSEPIPLEKTYYKKIRKLLETCNEEMYLLCNGAVISGIGKLYQNGELPAHSFKVGFKGSGSWDLSVLKGESIFEKLLMVNHGTCRLPKGPIKKNEFEKKFNGIFNNVDKQSLDYSSNEVWNYINFAQNQKHGTMIVITDNAESEANRLSNQSFGISKTKGFDYKVVIGLTSIDGALIVDPKGYCHAIGVILDGEVESSIGDISRGARFNAALKYLFSNGDNCLVIIISEDGYGDIRTREDILRPDLKARNIYYKHLLMLLNSDNIEIVKKAHEEYLNFGDLSAQLLQAEVMARHAKQHALQYRDLDTVTEFENIQNNNELLLTKKIEMFKAYHNKVIFDYDYD